MANIMKPREDSGKQSNDRFVKADHGHCVAEVTLLRLYQYFSPSQPGESLQHRQLQEQRRGEVFPFLNKTFASKQHQLSCCRPAASSLSPHPTGHLCCRTRSPPHTPEAPAATPPPSPQPPTLKQVITTISSQMQKWLNMNC